MPFIPPPDPWHARLPASPVDAHDTYDTYAPHATPCRDWLKDQGSLTARIRERCERFAVQVVRQELLRPCHDERAVLRLSSHEWAWVREVLLLADDVPVVFAHSVLAQRHARGHWQMFAHMGNKPLGAALFADPRIARHPLHFRRLDARHPLFAQATAAAGIVHTPPTTLWARRSLFSRGRQALLVTEVFLPGLFRP